MKKRVYRITAKRKKLVGEALETARKTRQAIDPGLLEKVREAIGSAAEAHQAGRYRSMQADRVPVDRKKNLTIVQKYLEMCPENKALHREVQAFLKGQ